MDWLVTVFQNPVVSGLFTAVAVEGGKAIYQKLLRAEKNTPEWQLFDSLDRAFFQTEADLRLEHETEAIRETFFSELFDFSSSFSIDTLKRVFQVALNRPATDEELKVWVANVVKQIALPEHEVLFRYLQTLHILPNELTQQPQRPSPILTPGASVWDDKNILARDEFINELCADFSQHPRRIQLVGMGGIGKTEILNKLYAKLAAKPTECGFEFLGFVNFNGIIESDIAQQIEYPALYHGLQGEKAALSYLHDLCMEHRVLLLIDDIREQKPLPKRDDKTLEYLTTLNASVLLASRVPFPQYDQLLVDVLPTDKCIEVFERQYGRTVTDEDERTLLTKIIEEKAGQNTLIVNRLGGMAKDPGWSIKELFDHLEAQQFSIPKGSVDDELLQQEINKLYTIDKSFTLAEISILEAFSIFPAIPLALDLCKEWLSEDAAVEPDECARILSRLTQRTWLVRHEAAEDTNTALYSMHQVVREAVKGQKRSILGAHKSLVSACAVSIFDCTLIYKISTATKLMPYALSLFDATYSEDPVIVHLVKSIGEVYFLIGDYLNSLSWRMKNLALCQQIYGEIYENTAMAYSDIAATYVKMNDYSMSIIVYMKVVTIEESLHKIKCPAVATTYNNLGVAYLESGDYVNSLKWFRKALEVRKRISKDINSDIAMTYSNIGLSMLRLNHLDQAMKYQLKALEIREKVLSKNNPEIADSYCNIAVLYMTQECFTEALFWLNKAKLIYEEVFGVFHPSTASINCNLASVLRMQGDYFNALALSIRALSIREKLLGNNHIDTAISYNNIASVYMDQDDFGSAIDMLKKALPVFEAKLGLGHPYAKGVRKSIEIATAKLASTDPAK